LDRYSSEALATEDSEIDIDRVEKGKAKTIEAAKELGTRWRAWEDIGKGLEARQEFFGDVQDVQDDVPGVDVKFTRFSLRWYSSRRFLLHL